MVSRDRCVANLRRGDDRKLIRDVCSREIENRLVTVPRNVIVARDKPEAIRPTPGDEPYPTVFSPVNRGKPIDPPPVFDF